MWGAVRAESCRGRGLGLGDIGVLIIGIRERVCVGGFRDTKIHVDNRCLLVGNCRL